MEIDVILIQRYSGMQKPGGIDMSEPRLWKHPHRGIFYVLWAEDGKQRQRSLKTRDGLLAEIKWENFKRDLRDQKIKPINPGIRQTFFPFCDEFLDHIAATLEISTCKLYGVALQKAKECWGDVPMGHITERHFDRLIADMKRAGLKDPTINKNYRHIKAALRQGRKWYRIKTDLDFPKQLKEKRSARFFTREQLVSIISAINDPEFSDFCLLSAYSGLRSGEQLRLTPSDVDNPKGWLRISPDRKNKEELRIPITKAIRPLLTRAGQRRQKSTRKRLFRFCDQTDVSHRFKSAARAAGLDDARFHDLRHTFGSHLAMAGQHPKAIQNLMGHASLASTDVYMNLAPDHLRKASESINYGLMPVPQKGKK